MKILLVHNFYGSTAPSGENKVFEAERRLLEQHGQTVEVFTRHSDEIRVSELESRVGVGQWKHRLLKLHGLVKGALCTIGNPFAARQLKRKIAAFKPDVVHFHNTFPLISPLAVRAAHRAGAKVVLTLHNYRYFCAAGAPTRDGKVCRECFKIVGVGSGSGTKDVSFQCPTPTRISHLSTLPAIRYRCYRGSLQATLPLAINIWLYRRCWNRWVDRFIVMSDFQKRMMVECGLSEEKIVVKAHSVEIVEESSGSCSGSCSGREDAMLFAGRLSDEKGVPTLIEAWNQLGEEAPHLYVAGGGDARDRYKLMCHNDKVAFLGAQPHEEVLALLKRVKAIVVPSTCYETFGLAVIEAAKMGVPAIVSDLGSLPSLIQEGETGLAFKPGDAADLARCVKAIMQGDTAERMGDKARELSAGHYTDEENYKRLIAVYREVASR